MISPQPSRQLGRQVSRNRIDVIPRQFLDGGFHQHTQSARTCALMHVIKLAHEVAGGTPCNAGNGPNAFEISAMTACTGHRGARTARFDQSLAFGDAAGRNVGDEF